MLYTQHFHNIFITNPKGPFGWEDRKWEEGKVVGWKSGRIKKN